MPGENNPNHCRQDYTPHEQYITCCHCGESLDDNPMVKRARTVNGTANWARGQLRILADMLCEGSMDRSRIEYIARRIREVCDGIETL